MQAIEEESDTGILPVTEADHGHPARDTIERELIGLIYELIGVLRKQGTRIDLLELRQRRDERRAEFRRRMADSGGGQ